MFEVGMMVKSKTMPVDTFGFITRVSNVTNKGEAHQVVRIRWFDNFANHEYAYHTSDSHRYFEVVNQ
jgi:hypothetical protein